MCVREHGKRDQVWQMKRANDARGHAPDKTGLQAAQWVARIDAGPLDEAGRTAFRLWLEEDADHRAAFEEASATWRQLAGLRHSPGALEALMPASRPSIARKAVRIGALVGFLLVAGGGLIWNQFGDPVMLMTSDYRTGPGELRTVHLPDGSVVELGPSSALALDYDARERRVSLLAGEAFFVATPMQADEVRPFIADAAGGQTRALGTRFVVELTDDGAQVLAVEHQIEVSLGDEPGVVLSPGEEVTYETDGGIGEVQARDVEGATAWRRGMLVFDDVPLRVVVNTLNRYRRGRIVILDGALASRRVSGVFTAGELDDAISTITDELGVRSRSVPPFITVLY